MLIRREDVAAVAVDYQERLMPVMQEKEALLAHSVILLRGLKELGVPIYLTQQYTRGLGMTVPEIVDRSQEQRLSARSCDRLHLQQESAGSGNGAGTGETGGRYPYNLRSASV